jgi:hypothetical protein
VILWLRNVGLYLVAAVAAAGLLQWMGSPLIMKTLVGNLSTIVLALLAINVQTTAVIAVKLRELVDKAGSQATLSVREFGVAIYEQAALVVLAFAIQATVDAKNFHWPEAALAVSSLFVLFAALHIFLDTTIGLLMALFPKAD